MLSMRDYMDKYFIEAYYQHEGNMNRTAAALDISGRTARLWKRRLVDDGKMYDIVKEKAKKKEEDGYIDVKYDRVRVMDNFYNKTRH